MSPHPYSYPSQWSSTPRLFRGHSVVYLKWLSGHTAKHKQVSVFQKGFLCDLIHLCLNLSILSCFTNLSGCSYKYEIKNIACWPFSLNHIVTNSVSLRHLYTFQSSRWWYFTITLDAWTKDNNILYKQTNKGLYILFWQS